MLDAKATVEHRQVLVAAGLVKAAASHAGLPALVRLLRRCCSGTALGGGLLFDGERVVVLFEGAAPGVEAAIAQLSAAPQIVAPLEQLADGASADAAPESHCWLAGYADHDVIEGLLSLGDAAARAQAFRHALGASDAL